MAHDETDYGKPLVYDPDFNGPLRRRSCTDIIFFLLFFVFIGVWIGIGIYAFTNGNVDVLLVPKDSRGSRCGLDSHVVDRPYLVFFDLTQCLKPLPFTGCDTPQVCVEKCPNKQYLLTRDFNPNDMMCIDGIDKPTTYEKAQNLVKSGKCAEWYLQSKPVHKRCVPNVIDTINLSKLTEYNPVITLSNLEAIEKNIGVLANAEQIGRNVVDDVIKSWLAIAIGLVLAMVVCIIYIVIMRWIAGIMVWISIFGSIAALCACTYLSIDRYIHFKNNPVSQLDQESYNQFDKWLSHKDTWLVISIISSVVLLIVVLVLIFLRKRIVLAIALIKEASKAVSSATAALFFPILPWVLQIGVIVYAIFVALYLTTVGNPSYVVKDLNIDNCYCNGAAEQYKNNMTCDPSIFNQHCFEVAKPGQMCTSASCHFLGTVSSKLVSYLHAYNVIGFFWLLFFVSAFGEMVLASTFATWYWTFRKSDIPFFTVTGAILRTIRYHIGTLAFGSLIIAICRMIRVLLEYIDHKLKKYENPVTKAILCCCKCFFWCLENFLRFINRNAYIMCAIHGKNFCVSAKDAFNLLMRNIVRVFVLDKVTDFLLFLSKIMITAGVICVAYVVFVFDVVKIQTVKELNYNYIPVIVIGVCTFFIASVFFSVFTMAVDTLFLCFLEDSERNEGTPEKPYYMSKELRKILGKKNK